MQASAGRLYLGFWSLSLRNLPTGGIQHRLIDTATAAQLIRSARDRGTLRCGSSRDLVAPYRTREARRHARLCAALSDHLNIPITQDEFLVTGEEGLTSIFPLDIIQLDPDDRLLIVDCCYRMTDERTGDFEDRFEVSEDSIEFHLFEPESHGSLQIATPDCVDIGDGAPANEIQAATTAAGASDPESPPIPLDEANTLSYPCTACAYFDYYATGEGRTLGLLMMRATSATDLVQSVNREFGEYFAADTWVSTWRGVPAGLEALDPRIALDTLDAMFEKRPGYQYSATLHFNAA